jgi:2-C-methyl-D-erythritol 4-phosphate cytidylyltransferase
MKASVPKQFLILNSRPVLHYSLHLFLERLPSYCASEGLSPPRHVVLVMDPKYQPEYRGIVDAYGPGRLSFANPGKERQGSVENGLNALVGATGGDVVYAAIHDSARPLVTVREVRDVVGDARAVGAAVLGVPCKATIKESGDGVLVTRTVPRSRLWEVHTPQVVRVEALLRGFEKVEREGLEVTDDVSIIEALGEPVRLTRGEYTNLKITTPEDMDVAGAILADRGEEEIYLAGCDDRGDGGGGGGPSSSSSSSSSLKNPFAAIPRAEHLRDREYNSLREVKLFDKDATGRRYPAKPTPSRWQE